MEAHLCHAKSLFYNNKAKAAIELLSELYSIIPVFKIPHFSYGGINKNLKYVVEKREENEEIEEIEKAMESKFFPRKMKNGDVN